MLWAMLPEIKAMIRTVALSGEIVAGDVRHRFLFVRPRSGQPTLTSVAGSKVETITVCSAEAFFLTCLDSGRIPS